MLAATADEEAGGMHGMGWLVQDHAELVFSPTRPEPDWPILELAHGRNERISLANMQFGTQVLYDVVRRFCAA